jgi:polysaccharide biosynthesis transport protein
VELWRSSKMMLQSNKLSAAIGNAAPSEIISPAELVTSFKRFIRRQFPVILFVFLLTNGLGVLYLLNAPRMYTAQASMIIDTRKVQLFQQQAPIGDNMIDTGMVDSQVEIMKSGNIALAVIEQLHLAGDPEFVGGGGAFGALLGWVSSLFGHGAPQSQYELTRRAAEIFASRLSVRRVGFSYIIQIGFESLDPQRAADIANAVADAYVVDQLNAKFEATRRAGVWLQDRLRELRDQAATAERAVVEFKAKHNIVSTGGSDRPLVDQQQVAELNSQLVIARTQVAEAQARFDRIEAVLRTDAPNVATDATVTDTLKNDVITKLRTQYLELKAREADWAVRYGSNHLAVVNLRIQMRELQNSILDELRRIGESYKSDYDIARQRETELENQLAKAVAVSEVTSQAQVELNALESNAKSYSALYNDFLQRYMESVQQESFPITEARVVTPAVRPLRKSSPKTLLAVLAACMGGLILGLGTGRLRDLSERVFRTRAQVEAALALDCLAVVPYIKGDKPKTADRSDRENDHFAAREKLTNQTEGLLKSLARGTADATVGVRTIAPRHNLLWQVAEFPLSPFTESIRAIKLAVDLGEAGKSNKVLGCTSSFPNEGKTTIAASLAQLMSHSGARVLLVDADLRAPNLSHKLAPGAKAGLLEVASGKASLDEVVWTDRTTNLTFLPTVAKSRLIHSAETLGSEGMKACFENLRKSYDYIVIDLSPLVPIVDVRATKALVDSYVFVVEWGRTKIDAVERALKDSAGIYDNILGVVLNKADSSALGRYEEYGYYHDKYFRRYGYGQ